MKHIIEKSYKEFELQLNTLRKEKDEERERNIKLLKQLEALNEELRNLRRKDEEREYQMKKKLAEGEEKIKEETRKRLEEEHRLKDAEKDKKLQDALKVNNELKRKLEQGSQQTQGEVLELEIEEILRKEFPNDMLSEVKRGVRGADVIQTVVDRRGNQCGMILWESKNAQWSEGWIKKLREDQREAKAQLAVLVVTNPPDKIDTFTYRDGIWITVRKLVKELAKALRFDLIGVIMKNLQVSVKMKRWRYYINTSEVQNSYIELKPSWRHLII